MKIWKLETDFGAGVRYWIETVTDNEYQIFLPLLGKKAEEWYGSLPKKYHNKYVVQYGKSDGNPKTKWFNTKKQANNFIKYLKKTLVKVKKIVSYEYY